MSLRVSATVQLSKRELSPSSGALSGVPVGGVGPVLAVALAGPAEHGPGCTRRTASCRTPGCSTLNVPVERPPLNCEASTMKHSGWSTVGEDQAVTIGHRYGWVGSKLSTLAGSVPFDERRVTVTRPAGLALGSAVTCTDERPAGRAADQSRRPRRRRRGSCRLRCSRSRARSGYRPCARRHPGSCGGEQDAQRRHDPGTPATSTFPTTPSPASVPWLSTVPPSVTACDRQPRGHRLRPRPPGERRAVSGQRDGAALHLESASPKARRACSRRSTRRTCRCRTPACPGCDSHRGGGGSASASRRSRAPVTRRSPGEAYRRRSSQTWP